LGSSAAQRRGPGRSRTPAAVCRPALFAMPGCLSADIPEALFRGKRTRRPRGRAITAPPCRSAPCARLIAEGLLAMRIEAEVGVVPPTESPHKGIAAGAAAGAASLGHPCGAGDGDASPDGKAAAAVPSLDSWPSIRESTMGWDFCSESSEDDDSWTEMQEMDVALAAPAAMGHAAVGTHEHGAPARRPLSGKGLGGEAGEAAAPAAAAGVPTFAELLRSGLAAPSERGLRPPAAGVRLAWQSHRQSNAAPAVGRPQSGGADEALEPEEPRRHGWKKQHKSAWSARSQRKLEKQSAKRAEQSRQARGL